MFEQYQFHCAKYLPIFIHLSNQEQPWFHVAMKLCWGILPLYLRWFCVYSDFLGVVIVVNRFMWSFVRTPPPRFQKDMIRIYTVRILEACAELKGDNIID